MYTGCRRNPNYLIGNMRAVIVFSILVLIGWTGAFAQADNYCLKLSSEGYVRFNSATGPEQSDTYSIQCWFNPSAWTPDAVIYAGNPSFSARLGSKPGELIFSSGSQTIEVNSSEIGVNRWTHLTLVGSPHKQLILINGVKAKETSLEFGSLSLKGDFFIGKNFSGRMDEFRIWKTEINPDFVLWRNTINRYHPQWDDLLVYYKFDQNLCDRVVDYKFNCHGTFSLSGSEREIVADNSLFKYRIHTAYTDFSRFADRGIDKEKYLLANDLIVLGIESTPEGGIKMPFPDNQGRITGGGYLPEYKGRTGVLSLTGQDARMEAGTKAFTPNDKYTFHTWIYLEKWTEGAFIFKKEASDEEGFSIRLGTESAKHVIVRLNGKEYKCTVPGSAVSSPVGSWWHLGVAAFDLSMGPVKNFLFTFNGKSVFPHAEDVPNKSLESFMPSGSSETVALIGEHIDGKLDETAIWHAGRSSSQIESYMKNGLPMPGFGVVMNAAETLFNMNSFWNYDNEENVGYDSYSYNHFIGIMRSAYEGYRGYKIRMSVKSHEGWQTTFANATKRKSLAAEIAKAAEEFDGIDLDFEWCYDGTCFNNYGKLIEEIAKLLPEDKVFTVSPHYVSYAFPTQYMQYVDYFLFQIYGPQPTNFKWDTYLDAYSRFKKQGYPDDKIVLSYATTTSRACNDPEGNQVTTAPPIGVRNGLLDGSYTPDMDVVTDGNGKYRFITGVNQTRNRAEFIHEKDLRGIFYWDMGNDVATSHPYSLVKHAAFAIASNVDTIITRVDTDPTGLQTFRRESSKITVYPNPATETISLSLPDTESVRRVCIYDATGRRMIRMDTTEHNINVSMLSAGFYILKIMTRNGTNYHSSFLKA